MLPDPYLAVKDAPFDVQQTVPLLLVQLNGQNSVRRLTSGAVLGEPNRVEISHAQVGKGAGIRDRRVVKHVAYPLVDGMEDTTRPASIYTVVDLPRGLTAGQLTRLWQFHVGLLRGKGGDTNFGDQTYFFDRWLQGES